MQYKAILVVGGLSVLGCLWGQRWSNPATRGIFESVDVEADKCRIIWKLADVFPHWFISLLERKVGENRGNYKPPFSAIWGQSDDFSCWWCYVSKQMPTLTRVCCFCVGIWSADILSRGQTLCDGFSLQSSFFSNWVRRHSDIFQIWGNIKEKKA